MNKRIVKNILVFSAGAGVGALGATLYLRNFYTKFINETLTNEVNKEINNIKAEYQSQVDEIRKHYDNLEAQESAEQKKASKPKQGTKKTPAKKTKEAKKEGAIDYTQFSEDKKKMTVKDVKKQAKKQVEDRPDVDLEAGSEIITMDDYTDNNGYDKVTTTYFAMDQVYIDDYDNPDPNMADAIGNVINHFDEYGDGSALYVRNDSRETDYEILYNEGTYNDYVTGL